MDVVQEQQEVVAHQPRVLSVVEWPDPRLRQISSPILHDLRDQDFQNFVADMLATLSHNGAVGLAAIQVGVPVRVIVVQDEKQEPVVMINPIILDTDGTTKMSEGCLSLRGLFTEVVRPASVTVEFFDIQGVRRTAMADKLLGRAILHEIDHLDGKVIFDRLPAVNRRTIRERWETLRRRQESFMKKLGAKKVLGFAKKSKADRQREKSRRRAGKR